MSWLNIVRGKTCGCVTISMSFLVTFGNTGKRGLLQLLRLVSATDKLLHSTKHSPYSRIGFKNTEPS
jgi:hypothetical protein